MSAGGRRSECVAATLWVPEYSAKTPPLGGYSDPADRPPAVGSPEMIGCSSGTRTDGGVLRHQAGAPVRICVWSSGQAPGLPLSAAERQLPLKIRGGGSAAVQRPPAHKLAAIDLHGAGTWYKLTCTQAARARRAAAQGTAGQTKGVVDRRNF